MEAGFRRRLTVKSSDGNLGHGHVVRIASDIAINENLLIKREISFIWLLA